MSASPPRPSAPARAAAPAAARPPGRPRREQTEEQQVRERLLDAATELAVEHGFDAVSLRAIARRARVSVGMIAYYFGDKQGLYEAMFDRAFAEMAQRVSAVLAAEQDSAERGETLERFVRVHASSLAADPWITQLITREVLARETPLRAGFAEQVGRGPLRSLVDWVEREQQRGALRAELDPQLTALAIIGLAAFPYLVVPVLGEQLGISLDDAFCERLIRHNLSLLSHGLHTRPEEPR